MEQENQVAAPAAAQAPAGDKHERQGPPDLTRPTTWIGRFRANGLVEVIDPRPKGAAMLLLRTSPSEDRRMNDSGVPTWGTPIMAIKIPKNLMERLPAEAVMPGSSLVAVRGFLRGVARAIEGRLFYTVELEAIGIDYCGRYKGAPFVRAPDQPDQAARVSSQTAMLREDTHRRGPQNQS